MSDAIGASGMNGLRGIKTTGRARFALAAAALAFVMGGGFGCDDSGGTNAMTGSGGKGGGGAGGSVGGAGGGVGPGGAGGGVVGGAGGGVAGAGGAGPGAGGTDGGVAGAGGGGVAGAGGAGPGAGGVAGDPDGGTAGAGGSVPDAGPIDMAPDLPPPPPPVWTELASRAISVQGGSSTSPGGKGQPGGTVHLVSREDIVLDPGRAAVAALPIPPANGAAITAAALAANVSLTGAAQVADVTSAGAEAVRTITVNGDLFITGTLRGADLGASRQGFTISAPGHIVYVTGAIDTSGTAGSGQAGGTISITASRVVVTGRLNAAGGDSATTGGAGGAITITSVGEINVLGGVDALGGDAKGAGAVVGGKAGNVTFDAAGDLTVGGAIRLRGGAGVGLGTTSQGGAGGIFRIESDSAVVFTGSIDARGGLATAATAGGNVVAGTAGAFRAGEKSASQPASIALGGPVDATGGSGPALAGNGGTFQAEPDTGNVKITGPKAIDVSGGDSMTSAGLGGQVTISGTSESSSGGVTVEGDVTASGGNVVAGGVGAGRNAGRIDFQLVPTKGKIIVTTTAKLTANGGRAGGANVAGGGGHIFLWTNDGDLTMSGSIVGRGGDAPDAGGTGGLGALIYLFTDHNGNGDKVKGGDLLIAPTGTIDASGGNGGLHGGSARNDGVADFVTGFPNNQEKIAIFLNCDNVDGDTINWLDNKGHLVARGGTPDGNGGDSMFHGIHPDLVEDHDPDRGNVDVSSGGGTGKPGDWANE
jgi:hypothetical protein